MRTTVLVSVIAVLGCGGSGQQLSDSELPVALQSWVRLVGERALDRRTGRRLELAIDGTVVQVRRRSSPDSRYRFVVQATDDSAEVFHARLSPRTRLPFGPGDVVSVHYVARWDRKAGLTRRAMAVRNESGDLIMAFQDHGLLVRPWLPTVARMTAEPTVVYTEAGRLARLCYTVVEHGGLRLTEASGQSRALAPGEHAEVALGREQWLFVAVDNARTLRGECDEYRPDRVSWFAVRTAAEP